MIMSFLFPDDLQDLVIWNNQCTFFILIIYE